MYVLHVTLFFFFNDTATTEIYTLSLHDALPILQSRPVNRSVIAVTRDRLDQARVVGFAARVTPTRQSVLAQDRKSTRLNSSHTVISYAVFCLKKKKKTHTTIQN